MAQNPGKALAAMRKQKTIECAECGAKVKRIATAQYCGNTCRVRAMRRRDAATKARVARAR